MSLYYVILFKYRALIQPRSSASADRFRTLQMIDGSTVPYSDQALAELQLYMIAEGS